jgi:pimeloyl-ACP methyl ester carboxylesterase
MKYLICFSCFLLTACYTPKKVGEYIQDKIQPVQDSITVGKRTLHYTKYGAADAKEKLVFIHEVLLDQDMWLKQVDYFSKEYEVITIDMRGHGKSGEDANSKLEEWENLKMIIEKEGLSKVHICVYGLYANSALNLALWKPDVVVSLCLISPNFPGKAINDSIFINQISSANGDALRKDWEAASKSNFNLVVQGKDPKRTIDKWTKNYAQSKISNHLIEKEAFPKQYLKRINFDAELPINQPVLLMTGAYEFDYYKSNILDLRKSFSQAKNAEIKAAGKLVNLENATLFNQLYFSFLKSL